MKGNASKRGGAPGWMTTFADLMALMLTFFVLLLALSKMDLARYQQAMMSIQNAFGKPWHGRLTGTDSVIGEQGMAVPQPVVVDQPVLPEGGATEEGERQGTEEEPVEPLYEAIRSAMQQEIVDSWIEVERSAGEIVIRFPERVSYSTGSADLQEEFIPILDRVADVIKDSRKSIVVVGHTDDRPISTPRFRSNWDLSAARASSVVHHLLHENTFLAKQIIAQGRADAVPLVANDSDVNRARNRRVEIIITDTP